MRRQHFLNTWFSALFLTGAAWAAPIPLDHVGFSQTIQVTTRAQPILGGGAFNARIGGPTLSNGVDAILWCVDLENYISPGQPSATYLANVIPVVDTTAQAPYVQKGAATAWEDGEAFNAQERFTGAGYLIEKIIGGSSPYTDTDLVRAIWRLTDLSGGNNTANTAHWENPAYIDALNFLSQPGAATARNWATVSGVVNASGDLTADTRQTFIVEVNQVPEPATCAMIGAGLTLLAFFGRRRRSR